MVVTTGLDDVWVASSTSLFRIRSGRRRGPRRPLHGCGSRSIGRDIRRRGRDAVWVTRATTAPYFGSSAYPRLADRGNHLAGRSSERHRDRPTEACWIADEFGDLIRVDERTGRETERLEIGGTPRALAATEDRLWVVDSEGLVVLVSLDTREVRQSIPIGGRPVDVAVGSGVVWIAGSAWGAVADDRRDKLGAGRIRLRTSRPSCRNHDRRESRGDLGTDRQPADTPFSVTLVAGPGYFAEWRCCPHDARGRSEAGRLVSRAGRLAPRRERPRITGSSRPASDRRRGRRGTGSARLFGWPQTFADGWIPSTRTPISAPTSWRSAPTRSPSCAELFGSLFSRLRRIRSGRSRRDPAPLITRR